MDIHVRAITNPLRKHLATHVAIQHSSKKGKIENNVAVDCQTPFKWSEVINWKIVPTQDFSTGKIASKVV